MKQHLSHTPGPIGVFDSGYGGLTILDKIREVLPEYDYIYLGDNARAPYGTRSFEVVYEFTRQTVRHSDMTKDIGRLFRIQFHRTQDRKQKNKQDMRCFHTNKQLDDKLIF